MLKEKQNLTKWVKGTWGGPLGFKYDTQTGPKEEFRLIRAFVRAVRADEREKCRERVIAEGQRRNLHPDAYQWAAEAAIREGKG